MTTTPRQRPVLILCVAAAVAGGGLLAIAPAPGDGATTASRGYTPYTLKQPASAGLDVAPPLDELRATSAIRVIVPDQWARRSAAAGRLRLLAPRHGGCRYSLELRVRSVVAAGAGDAPARVLAHLPAAAPNYVLDGGQRGSGAFRVIRRKTTDGRVRVAGVWAGRLTRRADIVPAGSTAWSELHVAAISQPGDECHAGSYREALGPTIGDMLAAARTTLRFTRP